MLVSLFVLSSVFGVVPGMTPEGEQSAAVKMTEKWQSLFEWSQKERRGLTFYVQGNTIAGIVVTIGQDFVEVRNQEYGSILIKLDRIDAVAGK